MAPPTTVPIAEPEQPAKAYMQGEASQDTVSQQPSSSQSMQFQKMGAEEPKVSMRGGGCIADW
ncbi:MAG: hypothetical protein M1820_006020 [Bogoriella megaspora]|nr:MAG: hypothetical protein M1820_006020 [Bogoriella megaspora]